MLAVLLTVLLAALGTLVAAVALLTVFLLMAVAEGTG